VKTAAHGAEAVQLAKQHKFCLIFMDLQMPAMDGFTATREIRKVSGDTPVIALSADTCLAEQQRCEQEGMKGFVIKPTHTEVLQHVIEQTHDPRKCSYCASKT
jgi:two-component system sensor histidine kinase BarA